MHVDVWSLRQFDPISAAFGTSQRALRHPRDVIRRGTFSSRHDVRVRSVVRAAIEILYQTKPLGHGSRDSQSNPGCALSHDSKNSN
jgi:hypothetical protein